MKKGDGDRGDGNDGDDGDGTPIVAPNFIIGVSGKFGAGKDTVAGMIADTLMFAKTQPYIWYFSDNVKRIVSILTCTPLEDHFDEARKGQTARGFNHTHARLHQLIGEGFKDLLHDPAIWAKSLMNAIRKQMAAASQPGAHIIADLRFPSEYDAIKAYDRGDCDEGAVDGVGEDVDIGWANGGDGGRWGKGITLRVIRPGRHRNDGRDPNHISETALDSHSFNHTIVNDGTLEDLRVKVRKFLVSVGLLDK